MRFTPILAVILLTLGLTAQKEADARVAPGKAAPRGKLLEWSSAEGKPYWYRLPKKVDKKHPPSLILMFHGTGGSHGWAFWNYPIVAGRFRPNDVVVAPSGMTPGQGKTFNFVQGKKDGEHIAGLIKQWKKAMPIGRVYLYGHSQGAFFCYWFGGQYPELIDGYVAHAGNLLGNVKHPSLAKQKVAVGILHGKADAVVPVVCAHNTEKQYRKLGYQKVRKYIVEGLTERSGHWPLPVQVGEMFEWLDQVSVSSPEQAIGVALAELKKELPDLEVVMDALGRAKVMKKKAADAEALAGQITLVEQFSTASEAAHREVLLALPELKDKKAAYGSWAAQYRIAARAFGASPSWQKGMKESHRRSKLQQKQIAKAMKGLGNPSAKAFRRAVKTWRSAYLGDAYEELSGALQSLVAHPPRGLKTEEVRALEAMMLDRAGLDAKAAAAARAVTEQATLSFREEYGSALGSDR